MSDPQKYRTKEELTEYKDLDPIEHVLQVIQENNYLTASELETIEQSIKEEVEAAVVFAENSPLPEPSELYQDVYVQTDYPYITA